MSWSYLQEAGAESTEDCFSDILPFAPSRLSPKTENCYCSGRETESCQGSRFGTTCARSTGSPGAESLMSSAEGSHAPTSAWPARAQESKASRADSGERWRASLARFDRDTLSWRTVQPSLLGDSEECSVTWPRSGMTVNGQCYPLPTVGRRTGESESGYWQTPVSDDCVDRKAGKFNSRGEPKLSAQAKMMPTPSATDWKISSKDGQRRGQLTDQAMGVIPAGGRLNPTFVEWLMGWPIGSTAFTPLEMDRFREFMQQHGCC